MTKEAHEYFKKLLRSRVSHIAIANAKFCGLVVNDDKDPFWGDWEATEDLEKVEPTGFTVH